MSEMKSLLVRLILISLTLAAFGAGATTPDREKKIRDLIQRLGERDWQDAVTALVEIGDPAVEPLIRTLKDRSVKTWAIHARSINVLAKIKTQRAIKAIIESLKDPELNQYARGFAVMAIADLKSERAVEVLTGTLKDKSQFVRWKSVQALGTLGDKQGVNALIRALKEDEDPYVRAAAVKSLQQIKVENAGALIDALNDNSWLVRLNSRQALAEMGDEIFDSLIKALKDSNSRIRWQAAWVLGRIKMTEAIEPLIESLADPDWMVRDEAAVALIKIDPEQVTKRLGGMVKYQTDDKRKQIEWILATIKGDRSVDSDESWDGDPRKAPPDKIYCGRKVYPCYPEMLDTKPDIPSPHTTLHGAEIVIAFTKDGKYTLIPVTVENGKTLDYKQNLWGKGNQLKIDASDFPTLARAGLHSEAELNETKMITERSIVEITELGRPERSSGAGFMSHDEDILSVLKGDNQLVKKLGIEHPQMAKPLLHIWNMILRDYELGRLGRFWDRIEYILYHDKKVFVKAEGSKGWQESLFDDEILGKFGFEIWRELDHDEKTFLRGKYSHLTEQQITDMFKKLSYIHTGEMAPYYIMRYGFYEGHRDYRADPIAIAWIFGFKSLEEIEATFKGKLFEALTQHFTRNRSSSHSWE
jgi:HEAT repeat protein